MGPAKYPAFLPKGSSAYALHQKDFLLIFLYKKVHLFKYHLIN